MITRMKQHWLILILLLVTGCNLSAASSGPQASSTPVDGNVAANSLASPRVMAWNPNAKQLAWYMPDKSIPLAEGISERSIVMTCLVSPSSDGIVTYLGGDTAQPILYPANGGKPIILGETIGLACSLPYRAQFKNDGSQFSVISYPPNTVRNAPFTAGTLRVLKMPEAQELYLVNDVTAFQQYDDGLLTLRFFPNRSGQSKSADLHWWDGKTDRVLEENIDAQDGCQFVTGRVIKIAAKVYSLFGEKCAGGSSYRLLETDLNGKDTKGNSKTVTTGASGGAYFINAGSNEIWPLPGGTEVLIATPNGRTADLAKLLRISLADGTTTTVTNNVIVPQYPLSAPPRLILSSNGERMAFVVRATDNGEALYIYDLKAPATEPALVDGGNRSTRIDSIAWTQDSQRLFYAISGDLEGIQSVSASGESKLVARGTFRNLVISPDGSLAAAAEQIRGENNKVLSNLVVINVGSSAKTVLVTGSKDEVALTPIGVR